MTDDERDIELLAASLRADASDLAAFVEALASKLEGALKERVKVVRKRVSLFSGRKRVQTITIDLGDHEYVLGVGRLEGRDPRRQGHARDHAEDGA